MRQIAEVEWPGFLSGREVGRLIARCRVGLSFKQSDEWPVPSPTRSGRLITAQQAVASEYVPITTRQGEIIGVCPQDVDFVDYSMAMLPDWKTHANVTFERYRGEMPMRKIMERVSPSSSRSGNHHAVTSLSTWFKTLGRSTRLLI